MKYLIRCIFIFACATFFLMSNSAYGDEECILFSKLSGRVIVGGYATINKTNDLCLSIVSSGGHWISLPFPVHEDGYYKIGVEIQGEGRRDILIDGESHPELQNVPLTTFHNFLRLPVFLEKGQHSVIFRERDNKAKIEMRWCSLTIERLSEVPRRFIETTKEWRVLTPFVKILYVGLMYNGSYINVNIARESALFTRKGYQYISYYDPEGHLVVGRRKTGDTYFEKYWLPININRIQHLDDPHNYISMQMDGDGYLHVAFGHHNGRLQYIRSLYPYEVCGWELEEHGIINNEEEYSVTYVNFVRLTSGDLLCMHRVGGAGTGFYRLLKYDTKRRQWQVSASPFITDEGMSSPYLWKIIVSKDGKIHLAWTWRLSRYDTINESDQCNKDFSGFSNKDISYAFSSDEGITWYTSSGRRYELPIKRRGNDMHTAERAVAIAPGSDFFNHFGSDYDAISQPHFVYTCSPQGRAGVPQQWHLYWNGKRWINAVVTSYRRRFNWTRPQQDGRASTFLMRPAVFIASDGTCYVISRTAESNNAIESYTAVPPYTTWVKHVIYAGPVGGWEPQADLDLWHSSGKLDMLLMGVTDQSVREAYSISPAATNRSPSMIRMALRRIKRLFVPNYCMPDPLMVRDYYDRNCSVPIWAVDDKKLGHQMGYIMEIDFNRLKDAIR